MNFQIVQHAPAGHGSEVAWALWAMIFWSLSLSKDSADSVCKMEDSVIALLSLDAEQRGLVPSGLNKTIWGSFMTQQGLYEEQWLLAYEANIKGWLPSQTQPDPVSIDPAFGFLKANNVHFYDSSRLIAYQPTHKFQLGVPIAPFSVDLVVCSISNLT